MFWLIWKMDPRTIYCHCGPLLTTILKIFPSPHNMVWSLSVCNQTDAYKVMFNRLQLWKTVKRYDLFDNWTQESNIVIVVHSWWHFLKCSPPHVNMVPKCLWEQIPTEQCSTCSNRENCQMVWLIWKMDSRTIYCHCGPLLTTILKIFPSHIDMVWSLSVCDPKIPQKQCSTCSNCENCQKVWPIWKLDLRTKYCHYGPLLMTLFKMFPSPRKYGP